MIFLVKLSLHMLSAMWKAAELLLRVSRWKNKLKHRFDRKKECAEPMKKSCLIAVVAVLAAVAGALGAVAVYLRRREKTLQNPLRPRKRLLRRTRQNKRRPKNIQGAPTVLRDCFGAPFFFEE